MSLSRKFLFSVTDHALGARSRLFVIGYLPSSFASCYEQLYGWDNPKYPIKMDYLDMLDSSEFYKLISIDIQIIPNEELIFKI